jgi:hypothetical protein
LLCATPTLFLVKTKPWTSTGSVSHS